MLAGAKTRGRISFFLSFFFFVDGTSKTDTGLRGVLFQPPARKD